MTIEATKEAIKVMQAYVDGETIEGKQFHTWLPVDAISWNWTVYQYRIAKPEPVEICVGMTAVGNNSGDSYEILAFNDGWAWVRWKDMRTSQKIEHFINKAHTLVNGTKRTLKAPEAK